LEAAVTPRTGLLVTLMATRGLPVSQQAAIKDPCFHAMVVKNNTDLGIWKLQSKKRGTCKGTAFALLELGFHNEP
jgi:hypothetical protein